MPYAAPTHKPRKIHKGDGRKSACKRGYDRAWQRFRAGYLKQHPLCAHCLANGITTMATDIDHIRRLQDGGAKYDHDNLQPLCKSCHSKKTASEK